MNTNDLTRERISACVDGELDEVQFELAMAALRSPEARGDWELYHQAGDVLRSDDMALTMSAGFSARMAARLDAEPTIIAPAKSISANTASGPAKHRRLFQSFAAAAAIATFAFIATQPLMQGLQGDSAAVHELAVAPVDESQVVATNVSEGVILRDPGIDDYLLAHQRFSPSVYSSAQYVRSATFAGK